MINLTRITRHLAESGVDFVVARGLSAYLHGSSFMTQDVDVACRMDPENLIRLFEALAGRHPVHRMTPQKLPFTRDQAVRGDLKNLYLSIDWGQLDCLGEIKGVGGYAECLAGSEPVKLDGVEIRVLSLDTLIQAKRAMGRPPGLTYGAGAGSHSRKTARVPLIGPIRN